MRETEVYMPKVSVCIPVYGVEKYIERCARSLFEQTMTDGIEFIFVNDCTKDKSIEILEKVLEEYPHRKDQVKIIHHEKNCGLVAARNTGLKHATGDYIIHCDSDDWVDPNMYEEMYNKAIATDADAVFSSISVHKLNTKIDIHMKGSEDIDSFFTTKIQSIEFNSLWNKMFRSKIAKDSSLVTPDHICVSEDLLRTVQMLLLCQKVSCCCDVYYHYNKSNTNSLTHTDNYTRTIGCSIEIHEILTKACPASKQFLLDRFRCLLLSGMLVGGKKYKNLFLEIKNQLTQNIVYIPNVIFLRKVIIMIACINYNVASLLWISSKKLLKLFR